MGNSTKRDSLISTVKKEFKTNWINPSGWANREIIIDHNINLSPDKLDVVLLMSTDGTDENSFLINAHNETGGTVYYTGLTLFFTSQTQIKLRTGVNGVGYIDISGTSQTIDSENYFYKLIVSAKEVSINVSQQGSIIPAGTIMSFGGNNIPDGWLLCNGDPINRTTYVHLYNAIGILWGAGDGSTTFNLPDLRGSFLRGAGSHGSETKSDGTPFSGKTIGQPDNDAMFSHKHNGGSYSTGFVVSSGSSYGNYPQTVNTGSPIADIYGTPRIGAETKPFNHSVNYIIKI